ncbi:MAG: ABC transporter permease [Clostridia bacterium]|nr:ABC transporter permease [Clostridia bacterium]MBQ9514096.1 ABC transporter permease [Clostridia bacterium]
MNKENVVHEPLFHIVKANILPWWKKLLIYSISILIALTLTSIFCALSSDKGKSPFEMFGSMFIGIFGTEKKIWLFLRDTCLLLGVSLAIVPAFKMKFWNLGANGQILMGGLACYVCLMNFQSLPNIVLWLIMFVSSIVMAMVWAMIPAIFKAFFKTNESLFTLMMNYLAAGIVSVCITIWAPGGSGSLSPINKGVLPVIGKSYFYLLVIIVVAILTFIMYFYLKDSKHGYELAVVGESENTAKYIGVNVKKVVIRTLALSGAICGLIGLLLVGSINHTISTDTANNMGFTAIMTAWLAKFNPIIMIGSCALITFVSRGMGQVRQDFGFYNNALANIVLGIIYFFIIGCEFFISYKLVFTKKNNKGQKNKEEKI